MGKGKAIKCSACFHKNKYSAKFCEECGKELIDNSVKELKKKNFQYPAILYIVLLCGIFTIVFFNKAYFTSPSRNNAHNHTSQSSETNTTNIALINEKLVASKKAIIKAEPNNINAIVDLADYYFSHMQFNEAINYYQQALKVKENQPDLYVEIGVCKFNLKKMDEAEKYFNKALKLKPLHTKALYNLGVVYFTIQKRNQAMQVWKKLIKEIPNSEEAKQVQQFLSKNGI